MLLSLSNISPLEYIPSLQINKDIILEPFPRVASEEIVFIVDNLKKSSSRDMFDLNNSLMKSILEPILELLVSITKLTKKAPLLICQITDPSH